VSVDNVGICKHWQASNRITINAIDVSFITRCVALQVSDDEFSKVICVDVAISNIWMAFLLFLVPYAPEIDKFCRADGRSIQQLANKLENYNLETSR